MPISVDHAKKIQTYTSDLGDLVKELNPVTEKEWAAFEACVTAHKHLMKIDTGEFLQLSLPFDAKAKKEAKPRKDCPRCQGTGQWVDPDDTANTPRPCNCKDVENKAWPKVKADWKNLLRVPA